MTIPHTDPFPPVVPTRITPARHRTIHHSAMPGRHLTAHGPTRRHVHTPPRSHTPGLPHRDHIAAALELRDRRAA